MLYRYLTQYKYSENIEVTVEFLTEIDKLVQLIESPIFTCKYIELYIFGSKLNVQIHYLFQI